MESRKIHLKSIVITLTLIVTLIVITSGFFLIIGSNSEAKVQYEEKNSKEVKQLTAESIEKIETIDTQVMLSGAQDAKEEVTLPKDEQKILDQELVKIDNTQKQTLLKFLAEDYSSIMHDQELEALRMLDNLIAQGKSEWEEIVARGENTPIVKGGKVSEYLAMVSIMEKNMDQSFETVLAKMKGQLEAEGIEADSLLKQYREKYNNTKDENRKIMMRKALEAITSK